MAGKEEFHSEEEARFSTGGWGGETPPGDANVSFQPISVIAELDFKKYERKQKDPLAPDFTASTLFADLTALQEKWRWRGKDREAKGDIGAEARGERRAALLYPVGAAFMAKAFQLFDKEDQLAIINQYAQRFRLDIRDEEIGGVQLNQNQKTTLAWMLEQVDIRDIPYEPYTQGEGVYISFLPFVHQMRKVASEQRQLDKKGL